LIYLTFRKVYILEISSREMQTPELSAWGCHMNLQASARSPSSANILTLKEKADRNDANAGYWYGYFREPGCGVAINLTEAVAYDKLAQQRVRAVYKYGFFFENGRALTVIWQKPCGLIGGRTMVILKFGGLMNIVRCFGQSAWLSGSRFLTQNRKKSEIIGRLRGTQTCHTQFGERAKFALTLLKRTFLSATQHFGFSWEATFRNSTAEQVQNTCAKHAESSKFWQSLGGDQATRNKECAKNNRDKHRNEQNKWGRIQIIYSSHTIISG
jgi:hypothetical protein